MKVRKSSLLIAAFTSLLFVIGLSATAIWRNSRNAQNRVAAMHTTHLDAGAALAGIRANVFLTGILTRDYLLETDPASAKDYVEQFRAIRATTADSFRILETAAQDGAEKVALERLRREVAAYWDPTTVVLDWSPQQKAERRAAFLRERVRSRVEVVGLAAQVEKLMTENFSREKERIAKADQDFQSSLGWTTGIALLLGLAIAGVTLFRMTILERNSDASQLELRRLSVQLRTTQEQERTRLSRELHDEVGQMLTGLRMELASIARSNPDIEGELSLRISHAKEIVEQTLRIVRNIAMLLRPSMLDDLGLTPALMWLAKEISRSTAVEIQPHIDPRLDYLPDAHRTCLYRVVQEGLTNAVKHAGAHRVTVSLQVDGEWVVGQIEDDGRGFPADMAKGTGLGLVGMEERIRELGGSLEISSSPGRGARIDIRLPRPNDLEESEVQDDIRSTGRRSWDRPHRVEAPTGTDC